MSYVVVYLMFGFGAILMYWQLMLPTLVFAIYVAIKVKIGYSVIGFLSVAIFSFLYASKNPGGAQLQGSEGAFVALGIMFVCLLSLIIVGFRAVSSSKFMTTSTKWRIFP
jgi:hypothetical protein